MNATVSSNKIVPMEYITINLRIYWWYIMTLVNVFFFIYIEDIVDIKIIVFLCCESIGSINMPE